MKKVLTAITVITVLVSCACAETNWWENKNVIATIKEGVANIQTQKDKPWVKNTTNSAMGKNGMIYMRSFCNARGSILTAQYGTLKDTVSSIGLPTNTIDRSFQWSNLVFNSNMYLIHSKDAYEYYYRLYQLISLRTFLRPNRNGETYIHGEIESGFTSWCVTALTKKKNWTGFNETSTVIGFYEGMGKRRFVQKAFFNYILFAGNELNDLSNNQFSKKYFAKFEPDWQRMRMLLEKLRSQNKKGGVK
ncbi:hypothetical protein [Sulfurospirillum sp. 1612]|uniref:hypothetical protein n=1 Tax=Sulfurospirillum sp. 1612 TaxID=3094835 RepID=UPI002F92B7A7